MDILTLATGGGGPVMATEINHASRDRLWLQSLGYTFQGEKQNGMCWDVWWRDVFGRIGKAGEVYSQGWVVMQERESRRLTKLATTTKP